jgi:dTDP-4-amino-4,6-dideoxygalactose transaminase
MTIPLIKPYIDKNIIKRVLEVLDSGYLTEGSVTKEFEEVFKKYIGCKYAIAVTSCTTGLEIALRSIGLVPGDEVIVPDYTYPATASVVAIVGATAVVVDINPKTMLIDYDKLENAITPKTKAIIPVSLFGSPLNYERLNEIKVKHSTVIIEDAACSIGAEYKTVKVGNHADITVFSFHPRKFITTGEGGMITTNNTEWADWMNSYKHFGMGISNDRLNTSFEIIGTNYKLSNILSAIGLEQLKIIDVLLSRRREMACYYSTLLKDYKSFEIQQIEEGGLHSYQSFCIFTKKRDSIMKEMRDAGVEVQIGTYSLHNHNAFKNHPLIKLKSDLHGSDTAFQQCLTLPLFHELTSEQQEYIIEKLIYFHKKI